MATNEMQPIAQDILKVGDAEASQATAEDLLFKAEKLRAETKIFLRNIEEVRGKVESFNEQEKKLYKLRKQAQSANPSAAVSFAQSISEYKASRLKEEEFKTFMQHIHWYQERLNAFFGQEIKTVYLYQGPKGQVEVYEVSGNVSDVLYADIASRGGGLVGRFSNNIANNSALSKMELGEISNVTDTYKEVLTRGEATRKELKTNALWIYWEYPSAVWQKMKVSSAGDIGEAYLYFALDEEKAKMFQGAMEHDIDLFMRYGVASVDNISGLLKGDFEVNGVQYAAKSAGASAMGYRQVLKLADGLEVMSSSEIVKKMQSEWNKLQKKSASGAGRRNVALAAAVDDTIDSMLIELTKRHRKT